MLYKKITEIIYGVDVHFMAFATKEEVFKKVKQHTDIDYSYLWGQSAGFYIKTCTYNYFIVLSDGHDPDFFEGILAHECMHVTSKVLRERGIELSDSSEEAYTYYLQYLMRELSIIYKAHKMKKSASKAVTKADLKKVMKQDKKDDMKMIKTAIKKTKHK